MSPGRSRHRVLLVHAGDLSGPGGAETSLRHHVEHRPDNVVVDVVEPAAEPDLSGYDAVVLGNLRPRGGEGEAAEAAWAGLWADRLWDYEGFSVKSERDVHPCAHRDGRCLQGHPLRRLPCDCSRVIPDAFEHLYNTCSAVQFLSPLHRQAMSLLVRIRSRQFVIAAPVDLEFFRPVAPRAERKRAALILGDAIRVAPTAEQRARDHGYEPERIPYLSVPYRRMPGLYNRYQAVVVDPVMLHAFGRVAAEALACGCEVLAGERVGALSWPDPLDACRRSNGEWWDMIRTGILRATAGP